jgi:hypothetical protein
MPRGGERKRVAIGTGSFGEQTVVIRVPVSMVDEVRQFIEQGGERDEPTCPLICLKPKPNHDINP